MGSPPRRPRAAATTEPPFETPPAGAPGASLPSGAPGGDQFEPPPSDLDSQDVGAEYAAFAAAYHVDTELQQMKQDLEQMIFSRPGPFAASARGVDDGPPEGADLIIGVGIGPAHRDFESVGPGGPGAPVLNVYVADKMSMEECKAAIVDNFRVRALASDQRPINIIHTGPIDAYAHRHRERPSPCGISVGHFKITAGTQGALARGRSGPRQQRLLMLSNNHVLANSNAASVGDNILQPGVADGGVNPADRIAILEKWVPINFGAGVVNFVDAATAWCWPELVRKEFIFRSGGAWAYFRVGATPIAPAINMPVGKSGRTTQLTSGRIIDISASVPVNYGAAGVANFRDQITIRGNNMMFSQGGDSGSLIWTWDSRRLPVGLLFAGGGEFTFANKINRVLDALDINLNT
jgi:hypothetical protein